MVLSNRLNRNSLEFIDQKGLESHLSQTKPIGGRDAALPRSPFKIEEELFPDRFDWRRESQVVAILDHIIRFIIRFPFRIPFRRRKDSLSLFFNKVMPRYAEKSCKGQWRIGGISQNLGFLNKR